VDEIWAIALKNINVKNNTSTSTAKHWSKRACSMESPWTWPVHKCTRARNQWMEYQHRRDWGAPPLLPRHQILSRFLYLKDNVDGNLDIMLENDAFFRTGITWEIEGDDGVKKTGRNPRLHVTRVPKIINGNVHFTRFCRTC